MILNICPLWHRHRTSKNTSNGINYYQFMIIQTYCVHFNMIVDSIFGVLFWEWWVTSPDGVSSKNTLVPNLAMVFRHVELKIAERFKGIYHLIWNQYQGGWLLFLVINEQIINSLKNPYGEARNRKLNKWEYGWMFCWI